MREPFILLDDARPEGASAARLYQAPREVVVARNAEQLAGALNRLDALRAEGLHLAGYLAYEAGLALEPKLAALVAARAGGNGPVLWFGAFDGYTELAAEEVPGWLAAQAHTDLPHGQASLGPLDPQLSCGGYMQAFTTLQAAIAAGFDQSAVKLGIVEFVAAPVFLGHHGLFERRQQVT